MTELQFTLLKFALVVIAVAAASYGLYKVWNENEEE